LDQNPVDRLRALKLRLKAIRTEHDLAALKFRQNQAIGDVLVGVGIRWLEDTFDLPTPESRQAAARLRARWRETPDYLQLEMKYASIEDEVRGAFRSASNRPPSLTKVRQASLIPTKIARLEAVVDAAIERLSRPPPRPATRRRRTSVSRGTQTPEKPTVWEILGGLGTAASVFTLILYLLTEPLSPLVAASLALTAVILGVAVALSRLRGRKRPNSRSKQSSERPNRDRDDAYALLAFGDTTNWMPWEAKPRRSDNEHFWRWWDQLPTIVNRLDPEDRAELLWILEEATSGARDRDTFRARYNALRKRAKEKARG
jgi:hypothetical protein